jgi:hypothetical protein
MWTVGFKHHGWDMSHHGVVFKAPGARALSGLKAYERRPHGEVGAEPENGFGTWHALEHALGGNQHLDRT